MFERYRFSTPYAEDLDLGIRLIRGGEKAAFLYRTRVLHSHNRPAYYFLKRGYVDARFTAALIPETAFPVIHNPEHAFVDIAGLWARLHPVLSALEKRELPLALPVLMDQVKQGLMDGTHQPVQNGRQIDSQLDGFIRELGPYDATIYRPAENMVLPHVLQHLDQLQGFLSQASTQLDEDVVSQIRTALPKIFALHAGSHLAYLYLEQGRKTAKNAEIDAIDKELTAGV